MGLSGATTHVPACATWCWEVSFGESMPRMSGEQD